MRKYLCAILALVAATKTNAADTTKPLNPNIGLVLNGYWANKENDEMLKGFSIGESELNINADIDPYLKGNFTIAFSNENTAEVEEAFIRTTSLPYGLTLTAGRMLPIFGYLNEKHRHTDDFALRPLVMRSYFDEGSFKADGAQASVVLPAVLYSELGGGAFGHGDFTAYARIGGGDAHAWRLGASYYRKSEAEDELGVVVEPMQDFVGADFKYSYSQNGNNKETEFSLYGEYIMRKQSATDTTDKEDDSGFYAAATYKWAERWRGGYMYSVLFVDEEHDEHTAMLEYNTSEFGRFRLQYSFGDEKQVVLQ
jgi:hypothetical protein